MVAIAGTSLQRVRVGQLRPTQMTVGMREVRRKRDDWHRSGKKLGENFIQSHMVPAIVGPKERFYIVDHHHLARALHDEGVDEVLVVVLAKLDRLKKQQFWIAFRFGMEVRWRRDAPSIPSVKFSNWRMVICDFLGSFLHSEIVSATGWSSLISPSRTAQRAAAPTGPTTWSRWAFCAWEPGRPTPISRRNCGRMF